MTTWTDLTWIVLVHGVIVESELEPEVVHVVACVGVWPIVNDN